MNPHGVGCPGEHQHSRGGVRRNPKDRAHGFREVRRVPSEDGVLKPPGEDDSKEHVIDQDIGKTEVTQNSRRA